MAPAILPLHQESQGSQELQRDQRGPTGGKRRAVSSTINHWDFQVERCRDCNNTEVCAEKRTLEETGMLGVYMWYFLLNLKPNDENELNETQNDTHWGTSRAGQAIISTRSLNKASNALSAYDGKTGGPKFSS